MALYSQESGPAAAPAIVFIHALATSSWMWGEQLAALPDYHCLAPDLPGHGRSNGVAWVSLADTAAQVAALIRERVPGGRAHLVGLSLGGYVVAQVLADSPGVVDHAILSGVAVLPVPHMGLLRLLGPLMARLIKTDVMLRMNMQALQIPEARRAGYRASARQTTPAAFVRASDDASRFWVPPRLAEALQPTLVVAGEREHPLIHQSQRILVSTLPHAVGRLAPGVGHGWNGEAPELFTRMVDTWVRDAPLPGELLPLPATGQAPGEHPTAAVSSRGS